MKKFLTFSDAKKLGRLDRFTRSCERAFHRVHAVLLVEKAGQMFSDARMICSLQARNDEKKGGRAQKA